MSLRAHTYASAADANAAIETIDAARPATETATTIIGPRGLRRLAAEGLIEIDRRTRAATLTAAGRAAGLVLEGGRCTRIVEQPARTWAHPIELRDGTWAVPVCHEVAGVEVEVRAGKRHRVPDGSTARTITAADRKVDTLEEPPVDVPPIGGGKGRT